MYLIHSASIDTMGDYLDLHAPQWIDFTETCSPLRLPDFFDKTHVVHERAENFCDSTSENAENIQPAAKTCVVCPAQADLDVIKSTPIKVVSPKNNQEVIAETTYDQVFSDAVRKLELCRKPLKAREAMNKTAQESNVFKTPNTSKIAKSTRSIGSRSAPNKYIPSGQDSAPRSVKVSKSIRMPGNDTSANAKETSVGQDAPFKQNENCSENDASKKPNDPADTNDEEEKRGDEEEDNKEREKDIEKCNEIDSEEHNEEREDYKEPQDKSEESTDGNREAKEEDSQDDVDAAVERGGRAQLSSSKHSVLTWHNHRRSLQKRRVSQANKKYVSLAEAVSRFQTETPERFRTRSNKAGNASMSLNVSRLTQSRLKPTVPVSPALISKNRARPVTVLSREEREKLEVEEMRKYQIKANPIPPCVLRGSRLTRSNVSLARKPTAAASSATESGGEKACATTKSSLQPRSPPPSHRDRVSSSAPRNVVTKVVVTDPAGIIVEREEITFFGVPKDTGASKNVTRIVPFSFEARNRDLRLRKEQRLKSLQEAAGTSKAEFHARPVPNFSKPPTPGGKQQQQQQATKKPVQPCPFSFDDNVKRLFERKEQLVKQVLEENKRARVFRANPAPIFKPVMVRGRSKEHLLAKDHKNTNVANERRTEDDQENKEPNVNSLKTERKSVMQKAKSAVGCTLDKQKAPPLKAYPLELNTDKRAKERQEFDEKLRRKEMEQEAKRQEAERRRIESERAMQTRLRKQAETKARPMPVYKPPVIVKATKQLTEPQSPAFASKLRSKRA